MPSSLRVLLLQIRDNPRVCDEEHQSFAAYSGLQTSQIHILNVLHQPRFSPGVVDDYHALFIGGASDSVLDNQDRPYRPDCEALLRHCLARDVPVFASCYGFQLAVQVLGGEIRRDGEDFEMGTLPISLAQGAAVDPLFRDLSDGFLAVAVHKDLAPTAPPGCELLAYTERCCHAFRVREKPFWAFQFHPEVDRATLVERLTAYRAHYTQGADHLAQVLAGAQETPESNGLVRRFVERVLLARQQGSHLPELSSHEQQHAD